MNWRKWYKRFLRHIVFRFLPHDGVEVVEEEWDYLIILDACRYDLFEELNRIDGELEKRESQGTSTAEWLRKNFPDYYEDIVYVSGNPHISNAEVEGFKGTDHFHHVENVWDYGWNEEKGTVPPEEITESALNIKEEYPEKKVIIHYMQPHGPYIGERKLTKKDVNIQSDSGMEFKTDEEIWKGLRESEISVGEFKKAWKDNLKLVLEEAKKLVESLDGKIIISSDHGDCFGEKFIYGHPYGIYINELIDVPWMIVNKNTKDLK